MARPPDSQPDDRPRYLPGSYGERHWARRQQQSAHRAGPPEAPATPVDPHPSAMLVPPLSLAGLLLGGMIFYAMTYSSLGNILGLFAGTSRYLYLITATAMFTLMVRQLHLGGSIRPTRAVIALALWYLWVLFLINFVHEKAYHYEAFPTSVMRLTTVTMLFFLTFSGSIGHFKEDLVWYWLIGSAVAIALLATIGGEVGRAISTGGSYRLGEFGVGNANEAGNRFLFGQFGCAFWFFTTKRRRSKLIAGGLFVFLLFFLGLTGSRKMFLGLLFFLVLLLLFRYRGELMRSPRAIASMFVSVLVLGLLAQVVLERTVIGSRLQESYEREQQASRTEERVGGRGRIYVKAVELFQEHPVIGIGLGNFYQYEKEGYASHSEYISTLVGTGIPGFLIYFSAYLFIWLALQRVANGSDPELSFRARLHQAAMLSVLLIFFGRWAYNNPPTMLVVATGGHFALLVRKGYYGRAWETPEESSPLPAPAAQGSERAVEPA